MRRHSDGIDERMKESLQETIESEDAEKIVEPLDRAARNAEDDDAEYWIRTTAQHLLLEGIDEPN